MTNKIAEIRARHAATEAYQQSLTDRVQMHDDRGYLLAEVERLIRERDWARADVDQLRGDREKMLLDERDFVRKHRAEVERLTRERDEARAEIENLYDQVHRWVDDRAKAQSQAERLREQNYELQRERAEARAEIERLTRERNEARAEYARLCDDIERIENDAWHDGAKHGTSH